jgi:hypothetical protein
MHPLPAERKADSPETGAKQRKKLIFSCGAEPSAVFSVCAWRFFYAVSSLSYPLFKSCF